MSLLKADDGRVVTVKEGLQVRKPSSEAIHVPLEQIRDEWGGRDCTCRGDSVTTPCQVTASFVLCLAFGVAVPSVCESDVSVGGLLRSGTVIVSRNFFRVPERDRERRGFVAGDFVLVPS
jgi:hypothetical protein